MARVAIRQWLEAIFSIRITETIDSGHYGWSDDPVYFFLTRENVPDARKLVLLNALLGLVALDRVDPVKSMAIADALRTLHPGAMNLVQKSREHGLHDVPLMTKQDLGGDPQSPPEIERDFGEGHLDDDFVSVPGGRKARKARRSGDLFWLAIWITAFLLVFVAFNFGLFPISPASHGKGSMPTIPSVPADASAYPKSHANVFVATAPSVMSAPDYPALHCRTGTPCGWVADGHIRGMAVSAAIKRLWRVQDVQGRGLLLIPRGNSAHVMPLQSRHHLNGVPYRSSPRIGDIVLLVKPMATKPSGFLARMYGPEQGKDSPWKVVRLRVFG